MNKFKCFGLLVFLVMAAVCISGCNPNQVTEQHEAKAKDGYREMNGQEFIFRGSIISPDPRDYTAEEAAAAKRNSSTISLEQEAMMEACAAVEQNTNCKILRKNFDSGMSASSFAAAYAAGQADTDFFYHEIRFARDLYISGYIEPVHNLEDIDSTDYEKWGNRDKQMSTTYKGVLYGLPCVGSNYFPYPYYYYGILLCKNDVYASFGLDTTPQEMIEAHNWTFDKFSALLPQLYDNSGSEPVYALVHSGLPIFAVYANGGDKVVREKNKYIFGYTKPEAIRAMEWAKSVYNMSDCARESDGNSLKSFYKGNIVFFLTNGYRLFGDIASNTSDYSWLPFPYGPDAEYGSTFSVYSTAQDGVIAIMKGNHNQRVQDTGYIVNLLFDATPHFGKTGYQKYIYRNYFDDGDTDSFHVYLEQAKNVHYDYSLELGTVNDELLEKLSMAMKTSSSVANVMESVKDAVNQKLDEELND